jgi:23S rRNA (uridine2552-2'-O)-methyltransferase
VASVDGVRVAHLIELAVDFAQHHMKREGALVVKLFHGSGYNELVQLFKANFHTVKTCKPKASRPQSAETFLIGMGLKTV